MPVHLLKIAVGIDSIEHFQERMKLRRKVVNDRYRGLLDAHYADAPVK